MAIEKERKFLLKPEEIVLSNFISQKIQQAYLMLIDKDQLRVRIIDDKKAFLCYKKCFDKITRGEYEYEIPLSDAKLLYNSAKYKLEKTRYKVYSKHDTCVDVYPNGLKVVEIEFEKDLDKKDIPSFCGKEISGMKKYSNIQIAKKSKIK